MATPEWEPPWHLDRPLIRRLSVGRFKWERLIKGNLPAQYVGIALTLATYSDAESGGAAHPGEERLAEDVDCSVATVRRALTWLNTYGWTQRSELGGKSGSRRGHADEYQLTVPAPLAVKLWLWSDDNGGQWMEWRPGLMNRPWQQP